MKNHWLKAVGAALYSRLLKKGASNSGAHRGAPLRALSFLRKQESISFLNNNNWIPVFTGMTQSKSKGRLGGILIKYFPMNSKGFSVLFLVFALLLMVTIGYVFSYLIPSKQKSVILPIQSTQAFFIAQSGVEFSVRYALSQTPAWTTPTQLVGLTGVTRNLGSGRFILTYNDTNNTLTSVGEVSTGTERRRIIISNFTAFVSTGLILVTPAPCWVNPRTLARFYIKNVGSSSITLTSFSAAWREPPVRTLTNVLMDGVQKFGGTYSSGGGVSNFTPPGITQTVNANQTIMVNVVWNQNISPNSTVVISFYDSTGKQYTFNLDPEGDGLPSC